MRWNILKERNVEDLGVQENNKYLLSIKEASSLFGIGQHRLREIISEDYEYKYHLMLGRVIKIKRENFEEFLNKVEQI